MSKKAMDWATKVVESTDDLPTSCVVVLYALAWAHFQDTGRCDPSVAMLQARTRLSRYGVQKAIKELKRRRIIWVTFRKGTGGGAENGTNIYTLKGLPRGQTQLAGGANSVGPFKDSMRALRQLPSGEADIVFDDDDSEGYGCR